MFQAFYAVPNYQREYVWEGDQVEQLLDDKNDELADGDPVKAPEYFMGSMVACFGGDEAYKLTYRKNKEPWGDSLSRR